jgi:hypothetical protein
MGLAREWIAEGGAKCDVDPLPGHFRGNQSQPTATVFACFGCSRGRPICHRSPSVATAGPVNAPHSGVQAVRPPAPEAQTTLAGEKTRRSLT